MRYVFLEDRSAYLRSFQWTDFRKNLQLFIVTLAAIVPDFDSGIGKWLSVLTPCLLETHCDFSGIADIFALATQYDTTTGRINNLTSKYVVPGICLIYRADPLFDFHLQLEYFPTRYDMNVADTSVHVILTGSCKAGVVSSR